MARATGDLLSYFDAMEARRPRPDQLECSGPAMIPRRAKNR
ncbi:MAG TPA: hypothetical protein VFD99_03435 [Arthrobacter sp.]|nr:hypothetical protein [Arthrobacter sp.]